MDVHEDDIKQAIETEIPGAEVIVDGDGRHFSAIVVSREFEGVKRLAQHRRVYDALGCHFASETLHALAIKTYTPERWMQMRNH